nr:MAG: hypothetical protein [Microvirus sp.]
MQTPIKFPVKFKHIFYSSIFEIEENRIFKITDEHSSYYGFIHKYTRKGFYYVDLFGNKSYITWASLEDVSKQKDDDNLPNQLPLFPDTEQI